jgi:hypothetical protein
MARLFDDQQTEDWENYVDEEIRTMPTHCQCDVEFGVCPGVAACPFSGEGDDE